MARLDAGQRLRRLLAVLAWLARRERAPIGELAERFGMAPEELVADLELAACCGLPPYTPDQLMEILVDDDEVVANLGSELARPRRLSPAEGFALAAAARAIVAVPGGDPDGALATALTKLDAAIGARGRLRVDVDEPPALAGVRAAVDRSDQLQVQYHSASRDELTDRVVDPWAATYMDGHWYLDGYCHRAGGLRRFRVDRILAAQPTGQTGCHVPDPATASAVGVAVTAADFVAGPENAVVRLAVQDDARWLVDPVGVLASVPLEDGRTEMTLAVSSTAWFGRLLLRLGPAAEVLDPPDMAGLGAQAARQVLDRYERSPGPGGR